MSKGKLRAALRARTAQARILEREELTDEAIRRDLSTDFGWKHGCAPFDVLERNRLQAMDVLFLIIHKHPADWLKSFHRKPYNSLEPIRKMSFSEFLRHPWPASAKENLPRSAAANPIDLWNTKHRSWLALRERGYRAIYIKNSDFLASFEEAIAPLAAFLPRKNPDRPFINLTKATKGSTDSIVDLKSRYVDKSPFEGYSDLDKQFVEQQIDQEVLSKLGYGANSR
jgi:hypothetical protein